MTKKTAKHSKISTRARYLSLLKKSLLDELYLENEARILYMVSKNGESGSLSQLIREFLEIRDNSLFSKLKNTRHHGGWIALYSADTSGKQRELVEMRNFMFTAHTMIGRLRLDNIHECLDIIHKDGIPGDLIETGVWKGGATVFMRGFLAAHKIRDRRVWCADSFEGLPVPSHAKDLPHDYSKNVYPYLSVSEEEVRELFERYELLDDQVCFLKGWFRDTLPVAPIKRLALMRLDGDLYESTMDALEALYPKLSRGGFVIVDDFYTFPQCADAVNEYRQRKRITAPLVPIDDQAVYWRHP